MPDRGQLIERHLSASERAEEQAVRSVAAAYRQARAELVARLIEQWPGSVSTPAEATQALRNLALIQQIDTRLAQLENEVGVILRDVVTVAGERAIQQIEREIALLPPSIRPAVQSFAAINVRMIEQFLPVALDSARLGTRALSLQLARELQMGLIQGQSFPELIRRVMAATPTGQGPAVWRNGEVSAELAVRRTVITAENAAKHAVLLEVRESVPEVQKQAVSALGRNTTNCCLRVHGQIQPVDEPFELTGTPRFADRMMYPAFHWRCRTTVSMYHPSFEHSGLTTANMRAAAQAELARRR